MRTSGASAECCGRTLGSSHCHRREPVEGLREALAGMGLWLPPQSFSGSGYVGAALFGIVFWERLVRDLALRARQFDNHLGDLAHGVLDGVADVDRAGLLAFHQAGHTFDEVVDVLHAPCLGAISVDAQGLAQESLSYEIRYHPAVIFPHSRAVAIKDAHDPGV